MVAFHYILPTQFYSVKGDSHLNDGTVCKSIWNVAENLGQGILTLQ